MKELFTKALLPLALAGLIMFFAYYALRTSVTGQDLYFYMLFIAGIPFGVRRMFIWLVPSGSFQWVIGVTAFNFIIGGFIGMFVLIWKMILAVFLIIKAIVGIFSPPTTIE